MDWWIVIGGGIAALLVVFLAFTMDRHVAKTRKKILESSPEQPLLGDLGQPTYLMSDQARKPVHANVSTVTEESPLSVSAHIADVTPLNAGYACGDFVTDHEEGRAVFSYPLVIVTETVAHMADLVPLIDMARKEEKPLVVVTGQIHEDVLETLGINAVSTRMRCVVVVTEDLDGFAEKVGSEVLTQTDLLAGYLPPSILGSCSLWVSDASQTWILPTP